MDTANYTQDGFWDICVIENWIVWRMKWEQSKIKFLVISLTPFDIVISSIYFLTKFLTLASLFCLFVFFFCFEIVLIMWLIPFYKTQFFIIPKWTSNVCPHSVAHYLPPFKSCWNVPARIKSKAPAMWHDHISTAGLSYSEKQTQRPRVPWSDARSQIKVEWEIDTDLRRFIKLSSHFPPRVQASPAMDRWRCVCRSCLRASMTGPLEHRAHFSYPRSLI